MDPETGRTIAGLLMILILAVMAIPARRGLQLSDLERY